MLHKLSIFTFYDATYIYANGELVFWGFDLELYIKLIVGAVELVGSRRPVGKWW